MQLLLQHCSRKGTLLHPKGSKQHCSKAEPGDVLKQQVHPEAVRGEGRSQGWWDSSLSRAAKVPGQTSQAGPWQAGLMAPASQAQQLLRILLRSAAYSTFLSLFWMPCSAPQHPMAEHTSADTVPD